MEQQNESEEELMERIKQMSPEELKAFQKSRCIFCHIAAGKIPSKKVYEDDKAFAVLDINPATKGHALVMPKEHYAIMPQVPDAELAHLSTVVKQLSQAALQSLGARGTSILIQNGFAAGQKAQHFLIHVIPRTQDDGIGIRPERKTLSSENYTSLRDRLRQKISGQAPQDTPTQATEQQSKTPIEQSLAEANTELASANKDIDSLKDAVSKNNIDDEQPAATKKKEGADLDSISRMFGVK